MATIKTRGFGPFSQLYDLLHTVLGSVDSFDGISGSPENSWILVLSRSFMRYCILFLGSLMVLRAFLALIKTHGFGPFS